MTPTHPAAALPRRLATRLETSRRLDRPTHALRRAAAQLDRVPALRALLRGEPLGHAAHPLVTDAPLGMWTSAMVLDLTAGEHGRAAADRLVGLGVLSALPAALTGLADWSGSPARVERVGTAHAALNSVALGLYSASWLLRRRGSRGLGVLVGLAGGGTVAASGYLGGHLAFVQRAPRHARPVAD